MQSYLDKGDFMRYLCTLYLNCTFALIWQNAFLYNIVCVCCMLVFGIEQNPDKMPRQFECVDYSYT